MAEFGYNNCLFLIMGQESLSGGNPKFYWQTDPHMGVGARDTCVTCVSKKVLVYFRGRGQQYIAE